MAELEAQLVVELIVGKITLSARLVDRSTHESFVFQPSPELDNPDLFVRQWDLDYLRVMNRFDDNRPELVGFIKQIWTLLAETQRSRDHK